MTPTKRLLSGLILVTVVAATGCRSHPPQRVAAVQVPSVAPVYTGPTSHTATDLASAVRAATVAHWYDVAGWVDHAHDQDPPIQAPSRFRARPESGSSAVPVVQAPAGDAATAVEKYFPDMFGKAWAVSGCESSHDPTVVSRGGGNYGLFQINSVHRASFESVTGLPWSSVLSADANAHFARWLFDESGGWGPWACRSAA